MFYRKNYRHEIIKGLQIDNPMMFISWEVSEKDIIAHFQNCEFIHITDSYYTMKNVKVFDTIICNIGLHFENVLKRIEFYRNDYIDLHKSYANFQFAFENIFGKPDKRKKALHDFENCEWNLANGIKIYHYVMDRFGLAEYLYIDKTLSDERFIK